MARAGCKVPAFPGGRAASGPAGRRLLLLLFGGHGSPLRPAGLHTCNRCPWPCRTRPEGVNPERLLSGFSWSDTIWRQGELVAQFKGGSTPHGCAGRAARQAGKRGRSNVMRGRQSRLHGSRAGWRQWRRGQAGRPPSAAVHPAPAAPAAAVQARQCCSAWMTWISSRASS